jgi:hypothetical protein
METRKCWTNRPEGSLSQNPSSVYSKDLRVTSSRLCKNAEDAVFTVFIETVKDRENNPIHAVDIHEANHRSRPSANLDKATLGHVGGPQAAPKMLGKTVEAKQFRQIKFQPLHHGRIQIPPASPKGPECRSGRRGERELQGTPFGLHLKSQASTFSCTILAHNAFSAVATWARECWSR